MEKGSIIIICLLSTIQIVSSQTRDECFTPKNLKGVCIHIKRCPSLITLLENQRQNSSVVAFLRNSLCGYEGNDPKVCCQLDDNIFGANVPTTTTKFGLSSGDNVETVRSSKLPSQSMCGRSNSTHIKIVGGVPADLGAWPWMTALGYQNLARPNRDLQWLCGGALISDRYVLTAAHCTVGIGKRKLAAVRLGDLDLDPKVDDSASPINYAVSRIIVHETYNDAAYTNDIALLQLENSVRFDEFVQPICLPILSKHRYKNLVSFLPFVAGWGVLSHNGPTTTALMETQVRVIDPEICKKAYAKQNSVIHDSMLCAGISTGGKDSCQGDSGSPLMWPNGNQYYLIGLVSFGYKCAEPGYPGVYAKVTHFVDWIATNMNNS